MVNPDRVRVLKDIEGRRGPVIYWMGRDQRVHHNWALLFAAERAKREKVPLVVTFNVVPEYLGATIRHFDFLLNGLMEVERSLNDLGIPFRITCGDAVEEISGVISETKASALVVDFDPLRPRRLWIEKLVKEAPVRILEVDAHNIVPCFKASAKAEFGAYTLRPKILRLLPVFLEPFPEVPVFAETRRVSNDWKRIFETVTADKSVLPVRDFLPGETAAGKALHEFVTQRLVNYRTFRNDPNLGAQSGLSPWLHFGQLSAQAVALAVRAADVAGEDKDAFLEELIIRRELSDNFCYYQPRYDSIGGIPAWARTTLEAHRKDEREFLYSVDEFEYAGTHDPLWNAAQREMMSTGKMHGYLRMYWAKKILEWSADPESAISTAIRLNDKYSLDGRDPNGYAGILWSIGGLHDRAWGERAVSGKVRYMNAAGCKRKFDTGRYIKTNS